jgi:hypothetical protein
VPEVAFCVAPKFLSSQTLRSSVPETTAWYSPVVSVSGFDLIQRTLMLIAELGEGRYIVQNAFFSAMALPAAGHEKDDRTVGSSIYLRGAGNQGKVRWACSLTKLVISSVSIRVSA